MKITLFILSFFTLSFISATEINYKVSMPEPHTHYFEVKMEISDFEKEYVDIKMPVWAPGSYLAREFAKNVNLVKAYDSDGNPQ